MVKIALRSSVERDLARVPRSFRIGLLLACQEIFDDWAIGKPLTGPLAGHRTHRVGVYRILYKVKHSSRVEIVAIGHRENIYEKATKRKSL